VSLKVTSSGLEMELRGTAPCKTLDSIHRTKKKKKNPHFLRTDFSAPLSKIHRERRAAPLSESSRSEQAFQNALDTTERSF
jgi:hypothetical protein